jgi:hypothetical protein
VYLYLNLLFFVIATKTIRSIRTLTPHIFLSISIDRFKIIDRVQCPAYFPPPNNSAYYYYSWAMDLWCLYIAQIAFVLWIGSSSSKSKWLIRTAQMIFIRIFNCTPNFIFFRIYLLFFYIVRESLNLIIMSHPKWVIF